MLIQTLRRAHQEALNQLNKIEICTEELSEAKKQHAVNPTTVTMWAMDWYTSKKQDAIDAYTAQMEGIIEPVMMHK